VARKGPQYGNLAAVPRNVLAARPHLMSFICGEVPQRSKMTSEMNFPD
jgi:hypothetical protein